MDEKNHTFFRGIPIFTAMGQKFSLGTTKFFNWS